MSKFSALISVCIALMAFRAEANPVAALVGKYKVNQCALYGFDQLEKATIRIVTDSKGNRLVKLFGYSEKDKEDRYFYLGSGVREAMGTDGTETWATVVGADGITFTERFDREHSNTWPDMVRETSVRFEQTGATLKIYSETVSIKGPGGSKKEFCELTSISSDKTEIQSFDLSQMADSKLETLIALTNERMGDLDQADVGFARGLLNIKKPSLAKIKEVLSVAYLPNYPDDGSLLVKLVKPTDDLAKVAADALGTVLTIANEAIDQGDATRADYAKLYKFQTELEKALQNRGADVRAYYVDWADSDSDGKGIFFIDTQTGEALYIGAAYFG